MEEEMQQQDTVENTTELSSTIDVKPTDVFNEEECMKIIDNIKCMCVQFTNSVSLITFLNLVLNSLLTFIFVVILIIMGICLLF
jgi:hypothetical protein